MPTIRGSFRRLEAPSDVFYLDIRYQISQPVTWEAIISGGSREIAPMQGVLEVSPESDFFIRDAVMAAVRAQMQSLIVAQG